MLENKQYLFVERNIIKGIKSLPTEKIIFT